MSEQRSNEGGIDPRLVELAAEPVRYQALAFLNEHPGAGAAWVAEALELDLEVVKSTLEEMSERGLVERTSESGKGERGYRALTKALWTVEELAELSAEERRRLHAWIVKMIGDDVERAMSSGDLTRNLDAHISRTVFRVDGQGWLELNRIQDEALSAIFAVQEAAAARLGEHGEDGLSALTAMFCCQLPDEPGRAPD